MYLTWSRYGAPFFLLHLYPMTKTKSIYVSHNILIIKKWQTIGEGIHPLSGKWRSALIHQRPSIHQFLSHQMKQERVHWMTLEHLLILLNQSTHFITLVIQGDGVLTMTFLKGFVWTVIIWWVVGVLKMYLER